MPTIETALGPIDTADLGFTLSHEHVCIGFTGSAYMPEFLDREATTKRVVGALTAAKEGGVDTVVDVAPYDQARDVRLQAEVSRWSGVNVIVSTGTWLDVPHMFSIAPIDRIADFYVREITEGIDETGIKAGIIKCASNRGGVKPNEERVLRAAARASTRTDTPIMTHTWAPERIGEQQVAVFEDEGVDMNRVCIGHSNDTTDLSYLIGLLERGVWLGMDRHGAAGLMGPTWEERAGVLKQLIDARWGHRIMLAHDWDNSVGLFSPEARTARDEGNPDGWLFITRNLLPRLKSLGATEDNIHNFTVDNPRRYFEGRE
jgi:phosphotriesterase-related protein